MRIDEIFSFEKGVLQSSKCVPGEFYFITASSDWKTHNEYTHNCEALIFAAAASGSLGRTHYVNGKFVSSDLCFIITPKDQENLPVDLKFYHILFNELKDEIVRNTKAGTSKEAIGLGSFGKYELPYFDIDTQIEIKNKFVNSEDIKSSLTTELNQQVGLVKKLRQQLLQDAVQGKLVEQNKKDEPASELLKKIKKQKDALIKQKKLKVGRATEQSVSLINEVEIPKSWQWCKSDEIFFVTKLAGFEYSEHISLKESGEIPVVRAQNVTPLSIDKTNLLYIDAKTSATLERCALIKKCLLVTFIGAGIGDVATFEETERWHLAPNVAKLEPFEGCEELTNVKYLNYYLMSKLGQSEIFKHVKATAQPSLSMGTIRDIDFAIPPIAEQNRIVQKLDELMQYCNELETSIKQSESQNEKILQQVLREALRKEPVEV
jgi:type I restriction enzyme S subunit